MRWKDLGLLINALLQHVSPLAWEHINLNSDYSGDTNKRVAEVARCRAILGI